MSAYTYAERRQMVTDRRAARVEKLQAEATAHYQAARAAVEGIPFGQPILVGHHSEGRHRRDLARQDSEMRKSIEASRAAEHVADATSAVLASDSDAVEVLLAKIEKAQLAQIKMTAANKLMRKNDRAGLVALDFTEAQVAELFKPDFAGRLGFPNYALTNNNSNIRRMKERVTQLEAVKALPAVSLLTKRTPP